MWEFVTDYRNFWTKQMKRGEREGGGGGRDIEDSDYWLLLLLYIIYYISSFFHVFGICSEKREKPIVALGFNSGRHGDQNGPSYFLNMGLQESL